MPLTQGSRWRAGCCVCLFFGGVTTTLEALSTRISHLCCTAPNPSGEMEKCFPNRHKNNNNEVFTTLILVLGQWLKRRTFQHNKIKQRGIFSGIYFSLYSWSWEMFLFFSWRNNFVLTVGDEAGKAALPGQGIPGIAGAAPGCSFHGFGFSRTWGGSELLLPELLNSPRTNTKSRERSWRTALSKGRTGSHLGGCSSREIPGKKEDFWQVR